MYVFLKVLTLPEVLDVFQAIWESKQVTAIELRFERPGLFNVDGEILEHDGLLRLRVLPQMMDMLVSHPSDL